MKIVLGVFVGAILMMVFTAAFPSANESELRRCRKAYGESYQVATTSLGLRCVDTSGTLKEVPK